jgi:RHH-type rel operon transcriptional repressor/antitoxin RelB
VKNLITFTHPDHQRPHQLAVMELILAISLFLYNMYCNVQHVLQGDMEKEKADQMIGIRIPKSVGQRLEILAQRTGRSKTYYIREAIMEHLDDLEDIYLAEQVLERVRRGEEPVSGIDEVEGRLGLAD